MKKAFTLLEIIVVIIIVSFLSAFIISKVQSSFDLTIETKIKSDLALIRNSITKLKTKNILLNDKTLISLDNEEINKENSRLFDKILDFPLLSTTKEIKEFGKWIKVSSNKYMVFSNDNKSLEFIFEDNSFNCLSTKSLCNEFE